MYNRADIQRVPQIIDLFDRNLTKRMAREADDFLANLDDRPDWGDAMATTIDCLEDVAFNNLAKTQANYRGYPLLRGLAEDDPAPVCPVWVRPKPDPRLVQPITSTLPTLILGGVYDPVTPPQYARLAGTTLVNSFYIEFPGLGHDVLGNDNCAGRLADAFLNVPTRVPTDACLGELTLPEFEPPVD
jgi:pimeloyl-ACP methyl ester carboxylesterase